MRPASLRVVVERACGDGDWDHHLQNFLDAFYARDGDTAAQVAMIAEDPGFLGEARPDAFLGGVGEHLARRWRLPFIPAWVRHERRYLETAMFVPDERNLRTYTNQHGSRPVVGFHASGGRPPPRRRGGNRR